MAGAGNADLDGRDEPQAAEVLGPMPDAGMQFVRKRTAEKAPRPWLHKGPVA